MEKLNATPTMPNGRRLRRRHCSLDRASGPTKITDCINKKDYKIIQKTYLLNIPVIIIK
jgi:hypothetical protein